MIANGFESEKRWENPCGNRQQSTEETSWIPEQNDTKPSNAVDFLHDIETQLGEASGMMLSLKEHYVRSVASNYKFTHVHSSNNFSRFS